MTNVATRDATIITGKTWHHQSHNNYNNKFNFSNSQDYTKIISYHIINNYFLNCGMSNISDQTMIRVLLAFWYDSGHSYIPSLVLIIFEDTTEKVQSHWNCISWNLAQLSSIHKVIVIIIVLKKTVRSPTMIQCKFQFKLFLKKG